jgi:hypothetical protein
MAQVGLRRATRRPVTAKGGIKEFASVVTHEQEEGYVFPGMDAMNQLDSNQRITTASLSGGNDLEGDSSEQRWYVGAGDYDDMPRSNSRGCDRA